MITLSENMQICIKSLIMLLALMGTNVILGTVNSLSIRKIKFDMGRMVDGIAKSLGIAIGALVLAYVFDNFDLSSIGYTPMTILSSAIIAYFGKCMQNMIQILGIDSPSNTDTEDITIKSNQNDEK